MTQGSTNPRSSTAQGSNPSPWDYTNSDLQIAATALRHNLTVVTRNVRDFIPTGVRVINPFEGDEE